MLEWLEKITQSYKITDIHFTTEDHHIYHLLNKEDIKNLANSTHYKATLTVRGKDCIDAAGAFINETFYKGIISMTTYGKCLGIVQQAAKK